MMSNALLDLDVRASVTLVQLAGRFRPVLFVIELALHGIPWLVISSCAVLVTRLLLVVADSRRQHCVTLFVGL